MTGTEQGLRRLLVDGAGELGVSLTEAQADSCFLYLSELRKWNRKINLTAIRSDRDVIIKHFLDSFAFLRGLPPVPALHLLDMGSGAGFPALPVKIAHPEISVTMVESVKKKASFLRHIIRTLKLGDADVQDRRTSELPESFRGAFDVVTARAFADMETALAVGAPFLKTGGTMVLSRGPEEGVDDSEISKAGMAFERVEELTLPGSDIRRAIWVFRKT